MDATAIPAAGTAARWRLLGLTTVLATTLTIWASVACGAPTEPGRGPTSSPAPTTSGGTTTTSTTTAGAPANTPMAGDGSTTDHRRSQTVRIRMTVGDKSATATLADNLTARDFASLLPVTLTMNDLFGLEKPGTLPRALDEGGEAVFTYEVGQLGYWSPGRALAVVYAVGGQRSIPSPGLIPLGTVDAGLEAIAEGGDSFQLRIEQID